MMMDQDRDLLEKVENKVSREDLLLQSLHPSIDQTSPAFRADLESIDRIAAQEAARTALGLNGFDRDSNAVVLREQSAVAIHRSRNGDLIIRQKAAWDEDNDAIIEIAAGNETSFLEDIAEFLRNEPNGGKS